MFNSRKKSQSLLLKQYDRSNFGVFSVVIICGLLIGVILFGYVSFAEEIDEPQTLKFVVVYHRHGARSPTKAYKKDPYADWKKYWPMGWGQLTLEGKRQLYELGVRFRKHYKKYIDKFTVQTVRVESSDADRCLMSSELFLAGMFPPKGDDQIWDKDLEWHPIPVHSTPRMYDRKLAMKAPCPRYSQEYTKVTQEANGNLTAHDRKLLDFLTENTGWQVQSIRQVEKIYSILHIQEGVGLTLPSWTKNVYPEALIDKAKDSMALSTSNALLKRLHVGPWINDLFAHLDNATDPAKNSTMKMAIYSGHDMGLVAVWRALDFAEKILPAFGATFIFELHEIDSSHIVKMLYFNTTTQERPYELQIPHCSYPCTLTALENQLKPLMPVNWEKECAL